MPLRLTHLWMVAALLSALSAVGCDDDDDDDDDTVIEADTDTDTEGPGPSTTRLADVVTFGTYYGRDTGALDSLSGYDLAIVQPLLTGDQLAATRSRARVAVYLSIGEIGLSNTYLVDGAPVLGQTIFDANPDWFLGKNPNFDAHFADANDIGWRGFVRDQADQLLALGYDGLFLDTVDTVDVFPDTRSGMVALIEGLREDHPDAVLVQNRGIEIIPESGPSVDALMFEVFSTRFDSGSGTYGRTDTDAPGYQGLVDKAVAYRAGGGVVLAQDFGTTADVDLACYARDRALAFHFVPGFADAFFADPPAPFPDRCRWPDDPNLGLAFDPAVTHLRPDDTAAVALIHDGAGGLRDDLGLSVAAVPSGVTATALSPEVSLARDGSVTLTTTAAPAGRAAVAITASAGSLERSFDLPVAVHDESVWITNAGVSDLIMVDEPTTWTQPTRIDRRTPRILEQPYDVAVAADGMVVVAENVGEPSGTQPVGRLAVFDPYAFDAPVASIDAGVHYPTAVVMDDAGTAWIVNSALDFTGTPRGRPSIATWSAGQTSASVAMTFAGGDSPTVGFPRSLTFGPDGRLWLTTSYGLVAAYDGPFDGGEPAYAALIIGLSSTGDDLFDTVFDLAFDADGDLWVTGALGGESRVVELPAGSWTTDGTVSEASADTATTVLTDGLHAPWGLAFDAAGGLWVVNRTDAADTAASRGAAVYFGVDRQRTGSSPSRSLPLESRYTVGIGIGRP